VANQLIQDLGIETLAELNDQYMIYDVSSERFILTEDACRDLLNVDLRKVLNTANAVSPSKTPSLLLNICSQIFYNWLNANSNGVTYKHAFTILIRTDKRIRRDLQDMLLGMVSYALSGGLTIVNNSGINLETGSEININKLIERGVSPAVKMMCMKNVPGLGVAYCYAG